MSDITAVTERAYYGTGSPYSFFRDIVISSGYLVADGWQRNDARDRLRAYRAKETRAMSSGSSSGGAFVTPEYLVPDMALYLSPQSSFAGQCTQVPDDGVGLQMNIPGFNAGGSTAQQPGENQSIGIGSAASAYITTNMTTQSANQVVSQQLVDRAGPMAFDKVMSMQLGDQLNATVDAYAVAYAIANASVVTDNTAFSIAQLYGDINSAAEKMVDALGNEIVPSHLFAQPKQIRFFYAQVGTTGLPLLNPTPDGAWTPEANQPSGQPAPGATGTNILGLAVYNDGNIAANGSNAQLLVARPSEFFIQCSNPYFIVVPEEYANTLSVNVIAYAYVGVVARRSSAAVVITGNTYPSSPTFL